MSISTSFLLPHSSLFPVLSFPSTPPLAACSAHGTTTNDSSLSASGACPSGVVMTLVGVGSILVLVNLILLRGRRFLLSLIILSGLVELVLSFPWDPLPSFKQAILPYFLPSSPPPESCFPYCESLLAVSTLLSATPFLSVCHYPR